MFSLLVVDTSMENVSGLSDAEITRRIQELGIAKPGPINRARYKKGARTLDALMAGRIANAAKRKASMAAKKAGPAVFVPAAVPNGAAAANNGSYATKANVRRIVQEELSKYNLRGKTRKNVAKAANQVIEQVANNAAASAAVNVAASVANTAAAAASTKQMTAKQIKEMFNKDVKGMGAKTGMTWANAGKIATLFKEGKANEAKLMINKVRGNKTAKLGPINNGLYSANWAKKFVNEQLRNEGIKTGITVIDAQKFSKLFKSNNTAGVNALYQSIKSQKLNKTKKNNKQGPKPLSVIPEEGFENANNFGAPQTFSENLFR